MPTIHMKKIYFLITFFLAVKLICASEYTLGTGDVVKLTVYEHKDLTTQNRVDGEGYIHLPLIGKVKISDLTIEKASNKIKNLFANGYIVNPQVNLVIIEYGSKKAVILGQVIKPGLFEIRENMTLLELISKAGGLQSDAGDTAIIKRNSRFLEFEDNTIIKIDLKALIEKGDTTYNIPIREGDSVYISKSHTFFVTGEVKQPGEFKYEDDTTVIKAITLAGGLTGKASPSSIKIIRIVDNKEKVMTKVSMDQALLPDDVVVVPESFF